MIRTLIVTSLLFAFATACRINHLGADQVGISNEHLEHRPEFARPALGDEAFDELSHDAQHAPRIGLSEALLGHARMPEQLGILRDDHWITNGRVDGAMRPALPRCRALRRRRPASEKVPLLRALLQSLERALFGVAAATGIDARLCTP